MSKKRVSVAVLGLLVLAACQGPEPVYQPVVVPGGENWAARLILVDTRTGESWLRLLGTGEIEPWYYLAAPSESKVVR